MFTNLIRRRLVLKNQSFVNLLARVKKWKMRTKEPILVKREYDGIIIEDESCCLDAKRLVLISIREKMKDVSVLCLKCNTLWSVK